MEHESLLTAQFLRSRWAQEFTTYQEDGADERLKAYLQRWAEKDFQKESSAAGTFVDVFFKDIWGYTASGQSKIEEGYTTYAEYPIALAGQRGGTGYADLALGWFEHTRWPATPQVFCEFKDVRSGLDIPQNRKGNTRSPVKQCADYLRYAAADLYGNEPIQPAWAIVTDMNEFRLYSYRSIPHRYQRFVIRPTSDQDQKSALLGEDEAASFRRFLFWKLFQPAMLLGTAGPSQLEEIVKGQWTYDKQIEEEFYAEYRAYRQYVYETLVQANPNFPGSRGKLVRLTQRFLDRCIFLLFCEDMGTALRFPPNLVSDLLRELSTQKFIHRDDNTAWQRIKALFEVMRSGGRFVDWEINAFNGGLFQENDVLESLNIPTKLFFEPGQHHTVKASDTHRRTLLYFSANYNFGAHGETGERAIGLYTLGRIFEQSITELEAMEAEADGRPSLTKLSKRKRDGVYYTPEWVVHYIVEETIGERLQELRVKSGLETHGPVTAEEADVYRGKTKRRKETSKTGRYLEALEHYKKHLNTLTVVDPACGSGAFLIGALQRLFEERRWIHDEHFRITNQLEIFDQDVVTKEILSQNIYGVDINAESVEIARLALWLHTATPGEPLCTLDKNIVCGNSLVGEDFYHHHQGVLFEEDARERVNVFNWEKTFPHIFAQGGFDCVIGNPPYVKLQNFRKIDEPVATYLKDARRTDGTPRYRSTQTGNFDLYLPFIEKGIELLHPEGRLGYIAPSVWLKNEYGKGLRNHVLEHRTLERWIDFRSYQVFDEATTYTALQFFKSTPQRGIQFIDAPDGELKGKHWDITPPIDYDALIHKTTWDLQESETFKLIDKLHHSNLTLGAFSQRIFVGIQTSADAIYHLQYVAPGRYLSFANGKQNPVEVEIEDAIMRPLISGAEAKRYRAPQTEIYLLFPYDLSGDSPRLWTSEEMAQYYPKAWQYLAQHEAHLRGRERGKFNVDGWYQFGRNQNIDKQEFAKLIVAQTVPEMRVAFDGTGTKFLNNVRVNGILARNKIQLRYLLGVLNSKIVDFVFRRIAKPKDNGYFEANRQFIAPLPIPDADEATQEDIGQQALALQDLHSEHHALLQKLERAFTSPQMVYTRQDETWLWADFPHWRDFRDDAPKDLVRTQQTKWAKQQVEQRLKELLLPLDSRLRPGVALDAIADGAELTLTLAQEPVLQGIYVAEDSAELIAHYWKYIGWTVNVTPKFDGRALLKHLLNLPATRNAALQKTIATYVQKIEVLRPQIADKEHALNEQLYALYGLSAEEKALVEADFER